MGRSTAFYRKSAAGRKKKAAYDKKLNARPEQKAKRAELSRIRYAAKKKGKAIDGLDYDHKSKRFVTPKANRGRRGEGGRKRK